jgi:hypothetical protein
LGSIKISFRKSAKKFSLLLAAGLIAVWAINPALAEDKAQFTYGLENNNPVFMTRKAALFGSSFRLAVKDGERANITVELVDLFADESGSKRVIPLNTSPFTPKGLFKFNKNAGTYTPSDEFKYFKISFKLKENVWIKRPVLGGLKISMSARDKDTGQMVVKSSVVGTFAYYPRGAALDYESGIALSDFTLRESKDDPFPFNLIPDLPGVYSHGNIAGSYKIKNTGNIFLNTNSNTYVISEPFLGIGAKGTPRKFDSKENLLVPGQVASSQFSVLPEPSSNELAPGIYTIKVNAKGSLSNQLDSYDSVSGLVIVFPWKSLFILLLVVFLFRKRIRKLIVWGVDYVKSVNEFRKSSKNPEKGANSNVSTLDDRNSDESLSDQSSSEPKATEVPSGQNFVWVNPVFDEPKNDSANPDDKRNL